MCTALFYGRAYFGRNLDVERGYGEQVVVAPRRYPFEFRHLGRCNAHYAMMGVALVADDTPLYFDAVNECGLAMAGLQFAGNARYLPPSDAPKQVASFELISWVLATCASVDQAVSALRELHITDEAFSKSLPPSPLHWMIADAHRSVTVEQTKSGLKIWENPVGVLTNNPPFDRMLDRLPDFRSLSTAELPNCFAPTLSLDAYSLGMGAIGLPGDWSSVSRFVRATFVKEHVVAKNDAERLNQFFHILDTVAQPKGCTVLENGLCEYTAYTSCYRLTDATCFYKTYDHPTVIVVPLPDELDGERLLCYEMV